MPEDCKEMISRHLPLDKNFYQDVLSKSKRSVFDLKDKFVIQPYSGKCFKVESGQIFRIVQIEGPQISDVWLYNERNPKEHYWSGRMLEMEGAYLSKFSRLWSAMPWFRPMATMLEETVKGKGFPRAYLGGFHHNTTQAAYCSTELWELYSGMKGRNSCHMNALQAIEPFGLTEADIHDNFNLMKCKIDPKKGTLVLDRMDTTKRDYAEFFAEMDLLVAVSNCPFGDGSVTQSRPDKMVNRPLGIEIYDTGVQPKPFPKWYDWRPEFRQRLEAQEQKHGLGSPSRQR